MIRIAPAEIDVFMVNFSEKGLTNRELLYIINRALDD